MTKTTALLVVGLLLIVGSVTWFARAKGLGPLSFLGGAGIVLGTAVIGAMRRRKGRGSDA